jgi:L-lactate dehydrogenase (cytochrome)/(S)-mandelate dehydrogenase
MLRHPRWLGRLWRARDITFANFADPAGRASIRDLGAYVNAEMMNPDATWERLESLRAAWNRPLAVKGVLHPDDAVRAVDVGADAIVVSNHGGRQLDAAVASLDALPAIAAAVGDRAEVLLDGGVRRGTDVLKAMALGADTVMIGRPYLYGLAAAGADGVTSVVELLRQEVDRACALMGLDRLSTIGRDAVTATHVDERGHR